MKKNINYDLFNEVLLECEEHLHFIDTKKDTAHGKQSIYNHVITVALACYEYAIIKNKKVALRELTRGALLHDYYQYDWHVLKGRKRFHGFRHPFIALHNAKMEFDLSEREMDIIAKHMWPLTLFFIPKYKESFYVMWFDKVCAIKEMKMRSK